MRETRSGDIVDKSVVGSASTSSSSPSSSSSSYSSSTVGDGAASGGDGSIQVDLSGRAYSLYPLDNLSHLSILHDHSSLFLQSPSPPRRSTSMRLQVCFLARRSVDQIFPPFSRRRFFGSALSLRLRLT